MAEEWSVLVFGDSWADYMTPTWPQILGQRLSARTVTIAQGGSMCADLIRQAQSALMHPQTLRAPGGGQLHRNTLVVVHTCGNDFLSKIMGVVMGGGSELEILQPNPGRREAAIIAQFLETMFQLGARHFLISGVPAFIHMPVFNLMWGIVDSLKNAGRLDGLGISPEDPPQLALEVQALALNDLWSQTIEDFNKNRPEATCLFFDEVNTLHALRESHGEAVFDRQAWDFSMFHPSPWGHAQLASEAHKVVNESIAPLAARAPHPEAVPKAPVEKKPPTPSMTINIRNVKGDIAFPVKCDPSWRVGALRDAVVAAAPEGFAPGSGMACILALQGKFLADGPETLSELGLADDAQLIAVMRPASAKPKASPAATPTATAAPTTGGGG